MSWIIWTAFSMWTRWTARSWRATRNTSRWTETKRRTGNESCFYGYAGVFRALLCGALVENGYEVAGVFTQPDKPKGRGGKVQMTPVKEYALSHEHSRVSALENSQGRTGRPEKRLRLTCASPPPSGRFFLRKCWTCRRLGTVNVHASLLPRHRGAAPVQWTVWQGETVTGVTTMFTDAGIDTGDILLQRETPIGPEETAGELTERPVPSGGRSC